MPTTGVDTESTVTFKGNEAIPEQDQSTNDSETKSIEQLEKEWQGLVNSAYNAINTKPLLRTLNTRSKIAKHARGFLDKIDIAQIPERFLNKLNEILNKISSDNWLSLVKQGRGLDGNGQPLQFVSKYAEQLFNAAVAVLSNPEASQDQWRYALDVLELLTKCDNPYKASTHLVLARSIFHHKADDFLKKKTNILPSTDVDHQITRNLVFEINEARNEYYEKHIKEVPLDGIQLLSDFPHFPSNDNFDSIIKSSNIDENVFAHLIDELERVKKSKPELVTGVYKSILENCSGPTKSRAFRALVKLDLKYIYNYLTKFNFADLFTNNIDQELAEFILSNLDSGLDQTSGVSNESKERLFNNLTVIASQIDVGQIEKIANQITNEQLYFARIMVHAVNNIKDLNWIGIQKTFTAQLQKARNLNYDLLRFLESVLQHCDKDILSRFVKEIPLADVVMITDHLQKGSRQYDLSKFLRVYFKIVDVGKLKDKDGQIDKIIEKIGCKNFYEVLDQIGAIQKKTSFIDLLRNETTADSNTYKNHQKLSNGIDNFNEKKSLLSLHLLCDKKYLQELDDDKIKNILLWLDFKHIESFFKFVMDIRDQDLRSRICSLILNTNSLVPRLSIVQKNQLIDQLLFSNKKDVESLKLPDPYCNARFHLKIFAENKVKEVKDNFIEILSTLSSAIKDLEKPNEKAELYYLKLALDNLLENITNRERKSIMSLLVLQQSEIHEYLLDRSLLNKLVDNLQKGELEQFKQPKDMNLARIILRNDKLREKYELIHESEKQDPLVRLFNIAWVVDGLVSAKKEIIEFIVHPLSENCANAFVNWVLQQQDEFKAQILQQLLRDDCYVYFNRKMGQLSNEVLLNLVINIAKVENTNEILKEIIRNTSNQEALLSNIFNKEHIKQFNEKQLIELFSLYKKLLKPNLGELLNMFSSSLTYVDLRSMIENYIWENYTFDNLSQGLLDENLRDGIADFICSDMNVANINKRINFIGSIIIKPKEERNKIPNDDMKKLTNFYDKHKDRISILLKLKLIIMNLGKLIRKMFGIKDQPVVTGVMSTKSTPVAHVDERAIPRQEGGSYQQTCQEMPDQHVEEVKAVKEALKEIGEYLKHLENRSKSTWKKKSTTFDAKSKIYQNLQQSFSDSTFANIDELKQTVEDQIKQMDKETGKESKDFRRLVDKLFDALKKFSEVSSQKDCRSLRSEISNLTTQRIIPYNELLNAIQRSCKQFNSEHLFQGGVPDGVKEIQTYLDTDQHLNMTKPMRIVKIIGIITKKIKEANDHNPAFVQRVNCERVKASDPSRISDTQEFYKKLKKNMENVLVEVKTVEEAFGDVLNPKESVTSDAAMSPLQLGSIAA